MENKNFDVNKYLLGSAKTVKDYILLLRTNLKPFIIITCSIFILAIIYALHSKNIYSSSVTLKISLPQQNVLEDNYRNSGNTNDIDRFISNEVEIINNYDTKERVAKALIDSFNVAKDKSQFKMIGYMDDSSSEFNHLSVEDLANSLYDLTWAEQLDGEDMIEIYAYSTSPVEAALIANTYANQYYKLNLEINRKQLSTVKDFLEKQASEKLEELNLAEDSLKNFKQKGGIVKLDQQSTELISQLASLDAQRDAAKIDLMSSSEMLQQYKGQLKDQNPKLAEYLDSQTSQAYIDVLQKQIADLQMNKDLALAIKNPNIDVTEKINTFDIKINELKKKLNAKFDDIKTSLYAGSPEQAKALTKSLIDEEMKNQALNIKLQELQNLIQSYENKLDALPGASVKLARYERKSESLEQLYSLVEKRYQESALNELSQPGNVVMIGKGRIPNEPSKPNRKLIALVGLIIGFVSSFGFILIKDYFNDSIKTPSDIQNENINVLAWIPLIEKNGKKEGESEELVILEKPDSAPSEAFRAIKARIQFSKVDSGSPKTILITSPAEKEGKTLVSVNLAISYAKSNRKTLLIDCDLRRPRVHTVLNSNKKPGLVDYLFKKASLDDIIKNSLIHNFSYIPAGTFPFYPAEILESNTMKNFLDEMRNMFDIIILDSAPIVAVVDSEILSKIVDASILVVSSENTKVGLMLDAVKLIKNENSTFLGTVLNNFNYKKGYGYYHKYYYNYQSEGKDYKRHRGKYEMLN